MKLENQKATLSAGGIYWLSPCDQERPGLNELNFNAPGFIQTQRQSIAPNRKFQWVSQGSLSQQLDLLPIDQSHFHQTDGNRIFTSNVGNTCDLAFYDLV